MSVGLSAHIVVRFRLYPPGVQILDGENHVPVLAPNDVSVVDGEAAELAGVEVFVVLRVGVAADEVPDVHRPHGIVAERQADSQVTHVLSLGDEKSLHVCSSL